MSLRYVILHHEGIDQPHFDLMFQTAPGSALLTWRCGNWPCESGDELTQLAEHRIAYLDYEGPVSGNRGHVRRVAGGTCQIVARDDNRFIVTLNDNSLTLELLRERDDRWRWHRWQRRAPGG